MSILRKPVVTIGGGALIAAGAIMLITPGPGLLAIGAGLALLAQDYDWADRLQKRFRDWLKRRTGRGPEKKD